MNAIVTVIGKDKVGIIAAVCIKLAEMNVNVLDISQTILDGKFTMVMAVDIEKLPCSFTISRNILALEILALIFSLFRTIELSEQSSAIFYSSYTQTLSRSN